MMRPRRLVLWAALLVATTLTAQSASDDRFVSPAADALVSGPTMHAVKVEPPDKGERIVRVTFSVDGRVVCHNGAAVRVRVGCGAWDRRALAAGVASLAKGNASCGRAHAGPGRRTRGSGGHQLSVVVTDETREVRRQLPQDAFGCSKTTSVRR
jgi:hypothetical protein